MSIRYEKNLKKIPEESKNRLLKAKLQLPNYQNLLTANDVTHLVEVVISGCVLDIQVAYELSDQDNRLEIEGIIFEALQWASKKLVGSSSAQFEKTRFLLTESTSILIKGSMKKQVSIANVSNNNQNLLFMPKFERFRLMS